MSRAAERLYVGGLRPDIEAHELEDEFKAYGRIKSIWVARKPPGFAFVEYEDMRDAEDAIRKLNGHDGWRVEFSRKSDRGPRGGGGGYGGGGGGGGYGGGGGGGGGREMRCYECNEIGHIARDCRLRNGGGGRDRSPPRRRDYSPRGRDYSPRGRDSPRKRDSPRGRDYSPRGGRDSPRGGRSPARGRDADRRRSPSPYENRGRD